MKLPRRARRDTGRPIPGTDDALSWVKPKPPARAVTSPPPGPGPLPVRHRTGGIAYTIRAYNCGCILMWDGHGRLTGTTPCSFDLDEELRNLTQ